MTKVIDPWGGSYYVEKLTEEITKSAWALIEEIEALGVWPKRLKRAFQNEG